MKTIRFLRPALLIAFVAAAGCSVDRPELADNEHLEKVGRVEAQRDIDDCIRHARELAQLYPGSDGPSRAVDARTAERVSRPSTDAILQGDPMTGAVPGSEHDQDTGLIKMLFKSEEEQTELNGTMRAYVEECLREKGYEVSGWK